MPYLTSENLIFHIIIAIPTFFIVRWIFRKLVHNKTYRIVAALITTIILTPFLYVGAIVIFFSILFHEPTKDFDKGSWQTDKMHRYQMTDDIIESKLLINQDSNQIKDLLGEKFFQYKDTINQTARWIYDMGAGGGGLGFLFHNLSVTFKGDKVIEVHHDEIRD